jgi:hypothetical protein
MVAVPLRTDFDARQMRLIAKKAKDGPQARRLLALTGIYDGASRGEAATIGGVTPQVIRDWVPPGPETRTRSSPPSDAGTRRWIRTTRV